MNVTTMSTPIASRRNIWLRSRGGKFFNVIDCAACERGAMVDFAELLLRAKQYGFCDKQIADAGKLLKAFL